MKALVNTKSNYGNLNGKWVTIIQFCGTIVYCEAEINGHIKRFDLNLSEVKSITQN